MASSVYGTYAVVQMMMMIELFLIFMIEC